MPQAMPDLLKVIQSLEKAGWWSRSKTLACMAAWNNFLPSVLGSSPIGSGDVLSGRKMPLTYVPSGELTSLILAEWVNACYDTQKYD